MAISNKDRDILRGLASIIREASERPEQQQRIRRWYNHNDLVSGTKPMVFCDPEGGWREIVPQRMLVCEDEAARRIEWELRIRCFYTKMRHDRVDNARWRVGFAHSRTDWGIPLKTERTEENGSFRWEGGIRDYAKDMPRLRFPEITVDREKTRENIAFYEDLFDGILEIEFGTSWWWSLGLTQQLVYLRGMEQFFYDMVDYPDQLHSLMAFLRDGTLYMLDRLEEEKLLAPNHGDLYVGSGGFGFTRQLPQKDYDGTVRLRDMWGFCESQESVSVSPGMFEEFVFQYQLPILQRFGLNCYGCCEPLNTRWDVVKKTPNLRRVSVSAWADFEKMAEFLSGSYVYSAKPNPAYVAVPCLDENEVRSYLRRIVDAARSQGCRLEMILKDCHTIGNNPENILRWCEIASEEAERY